MSRGKKINTRSTHSALQSSEFCMPRAIEILCEDIALNCLVTLPRSDNKESWIERRFVEDLKDPALSFGQCANIAYSIRDWLNEQGYNAWVPECVEGYDPKPSVFGYDNLPAKAFKSHYWLCLQHNDKIIGIDFAASQYDTDFEFPVIRLSDGDSKWASKIIPVENSVKQVYNESR